ncbi:MAG: hypothetical protein ACTTJS_05080 [Wolinella sp.]
MWLNFVFQALRDVSVFESILKKTAKHHSLRFATRSFGEYNFAVEGEREGLLEFSSELSSSLPLSLFFRFLRVEPLLNVPDSSWSIDEFKESLDTTYSAFTARIDSKLTALISLDASLESLQALATRLKDGLDVIFDSSLGRVRLSTKVDEKSELIMPLDLACAELLFRAQKSELNALATFEKPIITLQSKGVFARYFDSMPNWESGINVILPYDDALTIFAEVLRSLGIEFIALCFDDLGDGDGLFYEASPRERLCICVAEDGRFVIVDSSELARPSGYIELVDSIFFDFVHNVKRTMSQDRKQITADNKSVVDSAITRSSENNLDSLAGDDTKSKNHKNPPYEILPIRTLSLHLSHSNECYFWILEEGARRSAISFEFDLSPKKAWENIAKDDVGARLIENFSREFPEIVKRIEACKPGVLSKNLADWVVMAGFFAGFCDEWKLELARKAFWLRAKAFLGAKGPRVDFKLVRDGTRIGIDSERVVRSVMSFKLAGVDDETLAFGIMDSMAEFWGNLLRDMGENFAVNSALLSGSILGERPFLNKLLQYTPRYFDLRFPMRFLLDTTAHS